MKSKNYPYIVFVIFIVFLSGCGPRYAATNLAGKASVDGQTLTNGSVTFTPTESGYGSGVRVFLNSDGTYSAKSVPVGKVRVTIISEKKTGRKTKGMFDKEVDEIVSVIPSSKQEGVFIDIVPGQTVCNFEWESGKEDQPLRPAGGSP